MKRFFVLASLLAAFTAHAQGPNFPGTRPITIVVPFAAGGPTDRVARDLAEALRKPLGGGSVVVDNAAVGILVHRAGAECRVTESDVSHNGEMGLAVQDGAVLALEQARRRPAPCASPLAVHIPAGRPRPRARGRARVAG